MPKEVFDRYTTGLPAGNFYAVARALGLTVRDPGFVAPEGFVNDPAQEDWIRTKYVQAKLTQRGRYPSLISDEVESEDHPGTEVPIWFIAQPGEGPEEISSRWRSFLHVGPPGGVGMACGGLRAAAEAAGLALPRTQREKDVEDISHTFLKDPGESVECWIAR